MILSMAELLNIPSILRNWIAAYFNDTQAVTYFLMHFSTVGSMFGYLRKTFRGDV